MKHREVEVGGSEDLGALAQRGAMSAADALADLVGCRVLRCAPMFHAPDDFEERPEWETGVFCEVSGAFTGMAAVFLSSEGQRCVLKALCGSESPTREFAASVLSEFGNMLSSRAISAIGDGLGELLLPGLPELAITRGPSLFRERLTTGVEHPETLCVESELFEEDAGLRVLVVLALYEPSKLAHEG